MGLTVILEKFQDPSGATSDLLIHDQRLASLVTAFQLNIPPPNNLEETLRTVWTEPALFFALRDLVEAITLPHRAAVCCGRAIEGVAQFDRDYTGRCVSRRSMGAISPNPAVGPSLSQAHH
jgi:hypothetical protein